MREPRQRQRFPNGGKTLYELLRRDYEPLWIHVVATDDTNWDTDYQNGKRVRSAQQILEDQERTPGSVFLLTYEPAFDPMLYFWPVERQHVIVMRTRPMETDTSIRLLKAMERDRVGLMQILWPVPIAPAIKRANPWAVPEQVLHSFEGKPE